MEKLRFLFSRIKLTPDICTEPPMEGITTWNMPVPDMPGLTAIWHTPEEKKRVYGPLTEAELRKILLPNKPQNKVPKGY